MNRYTKILGTVLIFVMASTCLFMTYPDSIHSPGLSRPLIVAYVSLSRAFWSIVVGWLLFLCSTNQGGILNKILSCPVFTPLARLNYSSYLVHSTIIYIMIFNQTMPFYYQGHLIINNFVSNIFFSYTAAILIVLLFETPFVVIEKRLFKR